MTTIGLAAARVCAAACKERPTIHHAQHEIQQDRARKLLRTLLRSLHDSWLSRRRTPLRAGDPETASGQLFPNRLEPRRRAEQALVAVVAEAYVQGVSTRKVEALVHSLGIAGLSK